MVSLEKSHNEKSATVIGAGIGGLCTAIALQQKGWNVSVYDKATELKDVGAGIVLSANALKVLGKLGLALEIRKKGAPVKKAEIRTWDGKPLVNVPVHEQAQRYGSYSYLIYRPSLQKVLHAALYENTVNLKKRLVHIEQRDSKVSVGFEDGEVVKDNLVIGADGIHSEVRKRVIGPSPLRYSGFTAIRGISVYEDARFPMELGGGFEAWGHGKRFGFSHLGKGRIFWFAAINSESGTIINSPHPKKIALDHFSGWWEPVTNMIEATEESNIIVHEIFDRKPMNTWSNGKITLLGDAAHPMLPNLGQGGAQAMEDALVLSRCLDDYPNEVEKALKQYEEIRYGRTAKVVKGSRAMGRMMQLENPIAIFIRNQLLRNSPDSLKMKRLEWLLGHEV
ncbi:2-polyprenyl-6-methoxyphenol hydroxylase [Sutcliffiella cohnii]|uniref:2-polyprenyl-6-methoxyphenol hydroxylase n=1 Tax=Sutcliffiella cohnii TaxID=33932 RepID=A0A223KXS8_9BACI|nr:2-polyprenyl-6-methoxyphenol hydroxylase [Sutcliffiella cohnii]